MIWFDLDGTLLDFKGAERLAVQSFHKEYGSLFNLNCNPDDFYDQWCRVGKKHYARFLQGELSFLQQQIARIRELFGDELQDHEAAGHFGFYLMSFESHWKPFDDVIPCLQQLEGHRLGIITNGDLNQQTLKLKRMELLQYFEVVVASGEVGFSKPDVRIFAAACEKTGTPLHEMIYIGDDVLTDIAPFEALDGKSIWLNRRNEIPAVPVKCTIRTLNEVFAYLP